MMNLQRHQRYRYAYDAGMRVGDRLLAVDGIPVTDRTVDQVRIAVGWLGGWLVHFLSKYLCMVSIHVSTHP
jgi:hypothetical protein